MFYKINLHCFTSRNWSATVLLIVPFTTKTEFQIYQLLRWVKKNVNQNEIIFVSA